MTGIVQNRSTRIVGGPVSLAVVMVALLASLLFVPPALAGEGEAGSSPLEQTVSEGAPGQVAEGQSGEAGERTEVTATQTGAEATEGETTQTDGGGSTLVAEVQQTVEQTVEQTIPPLTEPVLPETPIDAQGPLEVPPTEPTKQPENSTGTGETIKTPVKTLSSEETTFGIASGGSGPMPPASSTDELISFSAGNSVVGSQTATAPLVESGEALVLEPGAHHGGGLLRLGGGSGGCDLRGLDSGSPESCGGAILTLTATGLLTGPSVGEGAGGGLTPSIGSPNNDGSTMDAGGRSGVPSPSPAPAGGSAGGSAGGGGSGGGLTGFITLLGLLLLAAPRALRRLRLRCEPWLTAFFVLIPERPG
jgi:hypothetical protein